MDNDNVNPVQEFEYKAEMKQLLHLIVHSLYTHPEVFIRELVSNSSDALNKLRFRRLTDTNILDPEVDLKISISLDKENHTFSIEDTGIGMTREELIEQIGTVASSGTLQFLKNIKDESQALDGQLIGQFGVGFYSVFMVTDEITIETRNASSDSKAFRWKSQEEDKFTIEEIDRRERGTKITFILKEDYKDFAEDYKVKSVLKKYSNFVDFPVSVNGEVVNAVTALWHRKKEDITDDELNEFYKFISNDFETPLAHLQLNIEGNMNFKALLFIPQTAPPMMYRDITDKSLHLYSRKVFISDNIMELLPDYLRFIKGVVDTEDLPLNVSREVTQSSPVTAKIRNVITSKVLSLLEEMAKDDQEKYLKFHKNFGSVLKVGLNSDFTNKDKLTDLLRFESSKTGAEEFISLKEYVERMKPDQKEIYYVGGNFRDAVEKNPNLEFFRKNDIEVLYLTDPVDLFTIPYIYQYDGKTLKSIDKSDIEIKPDEQTSEKRLSKDLTEELTKTFKSVLGDLVEDVVESSRLVDSPSTLVVGKSGLDPQMEKMMQMMDKAYTASKRILELNPAHQLIINLSRINLEDSSSPLLRSCILQIYEGAMLNEGYLKSPADFVSRMNEIMEKATK